MGGTSVPLTRERHLPFYQSSSAMWHFLFKKRKQKSFVNPKRLKQNRTHTPSFLSHTVSFSRRHRSPSLSLPWFLSLPTPVINHQISVIYSDDNLYLDSSSHFASFSPSPSIPVVLVFFFFIEIYSPCRHQSS